MITRNSLKQLINLTKKERFHKAIKEVQIYIIRFTERSKSTIHGEPLTSDELKEFEAMLKRHNIDQSKYIRLEGVADTGEPVPRHPQILDFERKLKRKRRRLHDREMHDQNTMRTTGADLELLAEAFQNLPALKTIKTVHDEQLLRPPIGAKQLYDGMGTWPSTLSDVVAAAHSTSLVLGAILKSGCQPEKLHFSEVPHYLLLATSPSSRKRIRTSTPALTFAKSQIAELKLPKLRKLYLSLYNYPGGTPHHVFLPAQWQIEWVQPLLQSVHELYILGNRNNAVAFLHCLNSIAVDMPHLRSIELQGVSFRFEDLCELLQLHRSNLRRFVCIYAWWSVYTSHQQIFQLLLDMPHMVYAEVYMTWHRGNPGQGQTIDEKSPEDFQRELRNVLSPYEGRVVQPSNQ